MLRFRHIEKIKDEKIQKQYTVRITTFFQGVNKNSGGLEEYAQKNLETLPEFAQSELYNILLTFAKQSDAYIKGEIEKEVKKQEEARKGAGKQEKELKKQERTERSKTKKRVMELTIRSA